MSASVVKQEFYDVTEIKDVIERWAVYRDSYMWDKFRTVWHPDGIMIATWTGGPFEDFIKITQDGIPKGLNIQHMLGGSAVEVNGGRAKAITKFIILQRATLEGVLCDVSCYGRQFTLLEKYNGKWVICIRETIADKDRVDPVDPNAKLVLDQNILDQFPVEYQYLAYLQTKAGYNVNKDCPRLSGGKALETLYASGEKWLQGAQLRDVVNSDYLK